MTVEVPGPGGGLSSARVFPIDLDLGAESDGRVNPSIMAMWESNRAINAELVRLGFTNPLLLFTAQRLVPVQLHGSDVTDNVWRDWKHFTARFSTGWTVLRLPTDGQIRLMVTVIDAGSRPQREEIGRWVQAPFRSTDGNLHDEAGIFRPRNLYARIPAISTGFRQLLYIDPEDLAPAPPRPVAWLLGEYFPSRPKDTCRVWHRLLPLLVMLSANVLIYWPLRLALVALMLLGGVRTINWSFANPVRVRCAPIVSYAPFRSIWTHKASGEHRFWGFFIINPFVLLAAPTIAWLVIQVFRITHSEYPFDPTWLQVAVRVDLLLVCIVLWVTLIIWVVSKAMSMGWVKPPGERPEPPEDDEVRVMHESLSAITPTAVGKGVRRAHSIRRALAWFKVTSCSLYKEE